VQSWTKLQGKLREKSSEATQGMHRMYQGGIQEALRRHPGVIKRHP